MRLTGALIVVVGVALLLVVKVNSAHLGNDAFEQKGPVHVAAFYVYYK